MDLSAVFMVSLRVAHALAATVWLGGGIYYLVAVRPASRDADGGREIATRAQQIYHEWSWPATLVMIATGVVLIVNRLSEGQGGLLYPSLLAVKVVVALVAFYLVSQRPKRRGRRTRGETILMLGGLAYVLGIVLTTVWPPQG